MPDQESKLRVFLCHASQDKPGWRVFCRLTLEGWIDPWLDEEKLLPGQSWGDEIEKAVETSHAVIVCVSGRSVNKEGFVQRELKYVLDIALEKPEGTIFIIPIRLEECEIPRSLRSWQYVNYFPEERRQISYQRLLESLKIRAKNLGIGPSDAAPSGVEAVAGLDPEACWKIIENSSPTESPRLTADRLPTEKAQRAFRRACPL